MIRYREALSTGYIQITVDGPINLVEFDVIADPLKEAVERHGAVSALEEIQDFTGNEPFFFWDELVSAFVISMKPAVAPSLPILPGSA